MHTAIEYKPRLRFRDHMLTFDSARTFDAKMNHMGVPLGGAYPTHDGLQKLGVKTVDSTGAFLVGELERLDLTLHEPLVDYTYSRDIDLREDVTIGDEVSSFTVSDYGTHGGLGTGNGIGAGKSWLSQSATQVTGTSADIQKKALLLYPWGQEIAYPIYALEQSARAGRPIDDQLWQALKLKHEMDSDEMVYVGDTANGATGMLNSSAVTPVTLSNGASGHADWARKTPAEILADVNQAITAVAQASGWAQWPTDIRIPQVQYGYIATTTVSSAGSISILGYLLENNVIKAQGKGNIRILPVKWCLGAGASGTLGTSGTVDRMLVYTKEKRRIRWPRTLLQRTPVQYKGIWQATTYYCKLGTVEIPYPETLGYFDGL